MRFLLYRQVMHLICGCVLVCHILFDVCINPPLQFCTSSCKIFVQLSVRFRIVTEVIIALSVCLFGSASVSDDLYDFLGSATLDGFTVFIITCRHFCTSIPQECITPE